MADAQHIGRYKIEQVIAVGAMATIYQAIDPKTGRKVAIKVLSRELSQSLAYRQRFENEARIIAALEHRYIIPIFDFGESNHQLYLVMRLMPGGTLADRIHQGPLMLTETARILESVAAALQYAHQEGIIHRDLKPTNILFDRFGEAALTDFGLARMTLDPNRLTVAGSGIMGTPQYMSPEVWQEAEATPQSDIYSLGVILFEMLTGFLPYHSDKALQLMQMHLTAPVPNILALRPDLPEGIQRVISRSLAKHPKDRYASLTEMIFDWREAVQIDPSQAFPDPLASSLYPNEDRISLGHSPRPSPSAHLSSSPIDRAASKSHLTLKTWIMVTLTAICSLVTAASMGAIWFWSSYLPKPVLTAPYTPTPIAIEINSAGGANKNQSQNGMEGTQFTPTPKVNLTPSQPPPPGIVTSPLPSLPTVFPTPILRVSKDLAVVINGVVYLFDFSKDLIQLTWTNDNESPTFSPDAKRLAFASNRFGNYDIFIINADGSGMFRLTDGKANNSNPSWSPDGKWIAFTSNRDGNKEIYLEAVYSDELIRLTEHPAEDYSPSWSPDGKQIVFVSRREGNPQIFTMDADGQNPKNISNDPAKIHNSPTWSPDGKTIAYVAGNRIILSSSDGKQKNLLPIPAPLRPEHQLRSPAWSPAGDRLAYIKYFDGDVKASDLCVLDMNPDMRSERCFDYISRKFSSVSWFR